MFAVILAVLEAILLFMVLIAAVFEVMLAVLDAILTEPITILVFKESIAVDISVLLAFRLILFDKLEVSIVTPLPPLEKL